MPLSLRDFTFLTKVATAFGTSCLAILVKLSFHLFSRMGARWSPLPRSKGGWKPIEETLVTRRLEVSFWSPFLALCGPQVGPTMASNWPQDKCARLAHLFGGLLEGLVGPI